MSKYKVVEKFVSINGEGRNAGELACFIRFAYCNLNCSYCDTKWANDKGVKYELMDEHEILDYVRKTGVLNVTLTGGEPLIQEDIATLIQTLLSIDGLKVEIETNGSVLLDKFIDISDRVSFTMDYKLAGSGMEDKMCLTNMGILRTTDTVKFVISDSADMERAEQIVKKYDLDNKLKVYFSSAFSKVTPKEIVEFMIERNLNKIRLQLQMHKYIWDPNEKGV